jgi:hypothetical protein
LGDAGEILDVAGRNGGVERELVDVLELVARELLDELLPGADDLRAGVVLLVRRDGGALDALGDGILDLERERAERLGVEGESDLVLPLVELVALGVDTDHAGERERHGVVRVDFGTGDPVAVELQGEPLERDGAAVDPDFLELGQGGIAEPVLEAEPNAVLDILEAALRVHLLEDEGWNLHVKDLSVAEG